MERIIQLVADLPAGSKTRTSLTNDFVDQLWSSLQHPPLSYLSDQFNYRQPDGSYNVLLTPSCTSHPLTVFAEYTIPSFGPRRSTLRA